MSTPARADTAEGDRQALNAGGTVESGEVRHTGITTIGDVPWGTHFCQFYQDKQDLIDILVPYFKAGLKNNEFCMWVTSEPLRSAEAKAALAANVENLETYIAKGQLEILDTEWYTFGWFLKTTFSFVTDAASAYSSQTTL